MHWSDARDAIVLLLHAAGLLLYIGLVQLIAEDFSREEMLVRVQHCGCSSDQ